MSVCYLVLRIHQNLFSASLTLAAVFILGFELRFVIETVCALLPSHSFVLALASSLCYLCKMDLEQMCKSLFTKEFS